MHIPESTRREINRKMFGNYDKKTDITLTKWFKSLPMDIKLKIVNTYEKKTMQTTPKSSPRRSPRTPPGAPKRPRKKTVRKSSVKRTLF